MLNRFVCLFALLTILLTTVQAQEELLYNEPVSSEMTEDEYEFEYILDGEEGDVVILELRPEDLLGDFTNPILIVTDPEGDDLIDTSEFFNTSTIIVALQLPEDGEYMVLVTRADEEDGETVGDFSIEAILAEELSFDTMIEGEVDSDNRDDYYTVYADADFNVNYVRTDGDFAAEVAVNTINDEFELSDVAIANGAELETAYLTSFDAETLYIVTIGRPDFYFGFGSEDAEYELTITEAE